MNDQIINERCVLATLMCQDERPDYNRDLTNVARQISDAGGDSLFTQETHKEIWRRVEKGLTEEKPTWTYVWNKIESDIPKSELLEILEHDCWPMIVESTYIPQLVTMRNQSRIRDAMLQCGNGGAIEPAVKIIRENLSANVKPKPLNEIAQAVIGDWEDAAAKPGQITGIASGIQSLDKLTWGWQNENLIVIGARPSQGKTAILVGFALHAAVKCKIPTAFFSVESSSKEIVKRMLCQLAEADQSRLRGGLAWNDDIKRLPFAVQSLKEAPLHVIYCPGIAINDLKAKSRAVHQQHGVKLILVDYLQKVKPSEKHEKRTYEVAQVSEGLKMMATELHVPVITGGQLSRENEKSKGRRPQLSDLADSGQIERDADLVALLHRENDLFALLISKFRDGPIGHVDLLFNPSCAKFSDAQNDL